MSIKEGGNTLLTKDLLKYTQRSGKIYPKLLKTNDELLNQTCQRIIEVYHESFGDSQSQLEKSWEHEGLSIYQCFAGMKKLILDHAEWIETNDEQQSKRIELILEAQSMRKEHIFESYESFQEQFSDVLEQPFDEIKSALYSDLPEYRKISGKSKKLDYKDLILKYNCNQIQGLLIHAKKMRATFYQLSLVERRKLFQIIKFNQLLATIPDTSLKKLAQKDGITEEIIIEVDGPLSIFEQSRSYGLKLASFFKQLLIFPRWSLEADIYLGKGKKESTLQWQDWDLIRENSPSSANIKGYIPDEFTLFLNHFNEVEDEWKASFCDQILIEKGALYILPDMKFTHGSGKIVFLELFHKWHKMQLNQRITKLNKSSALKTNLIIGVCKKLGKDSKFKSLLEDSHFFRQNGFLFSEFPTVKSTVKILNSLL